MTTALAKVTIFSTSKHSDAESSALLLQLFLQDLKVMYVFL